MTDDCAIAYIYFDYQERMAQTARNVLISLVKQLLEYLGPKAWPEQLLEKLQSKNASTRGLLNIHNLSQLLTLCAQQFTKTFLIFDALDEFENSSDRRKLFALLNDARKRNPGIKIFVTSPPHLSVNGCLDTAKVLSVEAHIDDIEIYIRNHLEYSGYDPRIVDEIVAKILASADGMYNIIS